MNAMKLGITKTIATFRTLFVLALGFGSAGLGLGACVPAEPATTASAGSSEPPLTDAKIEEIVASLGADARVECQRYVRYYCKQKGVTLQGCNVYADSVRGHANSDQGAMICRHVLDSQPQQPAQ
jgi:hypothetical protein